MGPGHFVRIARRFGLDRGTAGLLLLLYFLSTAFEGFGLAMLLPIFQYIQAEGDLQALVAASQLWRYLVDGFGLIGVSITLPVLLVTSFLCILLRQVTTYARLVFAAQVNERLNQRIRNQAFGAFLNVQSGFADRQRVGQIVNTLTTELRSAISILFNGLNIVGLSIQLLFYGALLVVLSPTLTLAALALVGVVIFGLRRLIAQSHRTGQQATAANQDMASFLVERLLALRLVRLSGTEAAEFDRMHALTDRQRDRMVRLTVLVNRVQVVMEPIFAGVALLLLYVATARVGLAIEEVGLFLVITLRLLPVVKELVRLRQSMMGTMGAVDAVERCLADLDRHREKAGGTRRFEGVGDAIRFDHVTFRYREDDGVMALDDVSLTIPGGKMTALVGPSGAGKSTLIDLLPRLRDPSEGRITIDGEPLEAFDLASLRAGIGYVPQAAQIFNVTAAGHIRYGRAEATDEELREAARLAGAAAFIERLPQGFDTPLGEKGAALSGGQRQRLDLARALIRKASVLIFDEPTSNLDADSESRFRETLQGLRRRGDLTLIIVGHRLSTVADADQIITLIDGRVAETGSPGDLRSGDGWYARALRKQTSPRPGDDSLVAAQ